jgi:hypothetical protein
MPAHRPPDCRCSRQGLAVHQESRPPRSFLACRRPLYGGPTGQQQRLSPGHFSHDGRFTVKPRQGSRPKRSLQRDSTVLSTSRLAPVLALGAGGHHPLPSAQPSATQDAGERAGCFPPPTRNLAYWWEGPEEHYLAEVIWLNTMLTRLSLTRILHSFEISAARWMNFVCSAGR